MPLSPEVRLNLQKERKELHDLVSAIGIEWFPSKAVADGTYARLNKVESLLGLDDKALKEMQEAEIDEQNRQEEMEVELS